MAAKSAVREPIRRMRPEDRREQIVTKAFELIAERGFNAVSLGDIAKACGIQKSSVLHHYPSMNDLLQGVLELREREDVELFDADKDQEATPATARARFTRVFVRNLGQPDVVRFNAILTAEGLAEGHPAHAYVHTRPRLAREYLATTLSWKPNPDLAAAELLAFWTGIEILWLQEPELDVRAAWESFCDQFFV